MVNCKEIALRFHIFQPAAAFPISDLYLSPWLYAAEQEGLCRPAAQRTRVICSCLWSHLPVASF